MPFCTCTVSYLRAFIYLFIFNYTNNSPIPSLLNFRNKYCSMEKRIHWHILIILCFSFRKFKIYEISYCCVVSVHENLKSQQEHLRCTANFSGGPSTWN